MLSHRLPVVSQSEQGIICAVLGVHPTSFSPASVQFETLEFCVAYLLSRGRQFEFGRARHLLLLFLANERLRGPQFHALPWGTTSGA